MQCVHIASDTEGSELPLLHLDALTAVRLCALHLEVVVFSAVCL
jgi:hypothetical protein